MMRSWADLDIRKIKNSYWWNSDKKQKNIVDFLKGKSPSLTEITIQITDKCNLSCPKCNKTSFTKQELDYDFVIKLINESLKFGLKHVHLTGGEPTQYSNLVDVVEFCSDKGLRTDFSSNGHFEESLVNELSKAGLNQINISYDFVSKIPPALFYLENVKLKTFVNHMLMPSNYAEIIDFIIHLHNNFPFVSDVQLMPPRGTAEKFSINEIKDYVTNYAKPSRKLASKFGYNMLSKKTDVVLGINEKEWKLAEQGIYHRLLDVPCMRGATELRVGTKGYSPCTYLYRDGFLICDIMTPLSEAFRKSIDYCFKTNPPNKMCQKSCSPELSNFNTNVWREYLGI